MISKKKKTRASRASNTSRSSSANSILMRRIKKLQQKLTDYPQPAIAVVASNPSQQQSHDRCFPYAPNTNLRYLTGITSSDTVAIVRSGSTSPSIISEKRTSAQILWEGSLPSSAPAARAIGASYMQVKELPAALKAAVSGARTLFVENIKGGLTANLLGEIAESPPALFRGSPSSVHDLNTLMGDLRVIKDSTEVANIRAAARLAEGAFLNLLPFIQEGIKERLIGDTFDYLLNCAESSAAFSTIVASGANAAILHYRTGRKQLLNGELLLLDFGATYNGYASDISRTVAVGVRVSKELRIAHRAVVRAIEAAIKTVRAGVSMSAVHLAAAEEIVEGLKELKILKGRTDQLLSSGAYKPYFPHSVGHGLGLDVHDVDDIRAKGTRKLEAGMVITVEPGMYLQVPIRNLPAFGIRIEDNILVTKDGSRLLTPAIPRSLEDLADLAKL